MKQSSFFSIILVFLSSVISLTVYHHYFNSTQKTLSLATPSPSFINFTPSTDNPAQSSGWSSTAPLNFTTAASIATNSVVSVVANDGNDFTFFGKDQWESSMGSGVILNADGYLVTNRHVIENMRNIIVTLPNKSSYPAALVGIDARTDLAVLKIDGKEFDYLSFANSDQASIGEWVLAVGNPFSLNSTVTAGIISAKGRNINILEAPNSIESFIQTDAAVNAGNSGGALVNTKGQLLGINTAILTKSGRYEGYSFAVPSNLVKKVCNDLIQYGAVQSAYIGINVEEMSLKIAAKLGMTHLEGMLVTRVEEHSAATDAGIQVGDVLLEIDGKPVNERSSLKERIALKRPGETSVVKLRRDKEFITLPIQYRNINNETVPIVAPQNKLMAKIGFSIRDLNAFEQELHQVTGVKVVSVNAQGLAAELKIREGFIIEFCNDVKVVNMNMFLNLLDDIEGDIYLEGRYADSKEASHSYIIHQ